LTVTTSRPLAVPFRLSEACQPAKLSTRVISQRLAGHVTQILCRKFPGDRKWAVDQNRWRPLIASASIFFYSRIRGRLPRGEAAGQPGDGDARGRPAGWRPREGGAVRPRAWELVAMISSRTDPSWTRRTRAVDRQLLGSPPPGPAESRPRSTWVRPAERPRLFQGEAGHASVRPRRSGPGIATGGSRADRAEGLIRLGEGGEAILAIADALLDGPDGLGQRQGLFGGGLEEVIKPGVRPNFAPSPGSRPKASIRRSTAPSGSRTSIRPPHPGREAGKGPGSAARRPAS